MAVSLLSHGCECQLVSLSCSTAHSQDTLTTIWKIYSQSPTNDSELFDTVIATQPKRKVALLKLCSYAC